MSDGEIDTPVAAHLGLGSNLDDRKGNLVSALGLLDAHRHIQVVAVSNLYETAPEGGPADSPRFLNAAIQVLTWLSAEALLAAAQGVERALGRRREMPNSPRTIDIDLLLFADVITDNPTLTLPHPRLHERVFVLAPLADINPDLVHPVLHRSISELLAHLHDRSGLTLVEGPTWPDSISHA